MDRKEILTTLRKMSERNPSALGAYFRRVLTEAADMLEAGGYCTLINQRNNLARELEAKAETFDACKKRLEDSIDAFVADNNKLNNDKAALIDENKELSTVIDEVREEKADLVHEVRNLRKDKDSLNNEVIALRGNCRELAEKLGRAEEENEHHDRVIKILRDTVDTTGKRKAELLERLNMLQTAHQKLLHDYHDLKHSPVDESASLERENEITELRHQITNMAHKNSELRSTVANLKYDARVLRDTITNLNCMSVVSEGVKIEGGCIDEATTGKIGDTIRKNVKKACEKLAAEEEQPVDECPDPENDVSPAAPYITAAALAILKNRVENEKTNPACLYEDWDFLQATKTAIAALHHVPDYERTAKILRNTLNNSREAVTNLRKRNAELKTTVDELQERNAVLIRELRDQGMREIAKDLDRDIMSRKPVDEVQPAKRGGRNSEHLAGAVYGFGAFLTTRPGVMEVGESQCADSMAKACKEYLTSFGAQDVEPDVPHANWATHREYVGEVNARGRAAWLVMAADDDFIVRTKEPTKTKVKLGDDTIEVTSADETVKVRVDGLDIRIDTPGLLISQFKFDDGLVLRSFLDPELQAVMLG